MQDRKTQKGADIPVTIAVMALAVVGLIVAAGSNLQIILSDISNLTPLFEENLTVLSVVTATFSFAAAWTSSQWRRKFKLTKQGSRLENLIGKKHERRFLWTDLLLGVFLGAIGFLACGASITNRKLPLDVTVLQQTIWETTELAASCLFAISVFILAIALKNPVLKLFRKKESDQKCLPTFPNTPNTVTIGSINEHADGPTPSWLTLGKRALNGNVIVTGSIGSGKTQGTILTYFDQILSNFDPVPSVLIVDPKGSFAPEAIKIINSKGFNKRCLHFTLNGKLSFNPIYVPNALKNAKFSDVAYMIQSAASNFMGRSSGSAFWETHSLTLIRNALAYCAAKNEYYTLLDLHETILAIIADEIPEKIKEILETKKFDKEEHFNLMKSYDYFGLQFKSMDDKIKTSILATATAFLDQFQEFQANRIFCPPKNQKRLNSLDEAIDQGKFIIVDIGSPALAKSMGTMIKLIYQQSVLNRLKNPKRDRSTPSLVLIDEYQDVVTTSNGTLIGDERFYSKAREANAISIVATPSLMSLYDAIGSETASKSLFQCFRTRIGAHSSDVATIHTFQELIGQEDREKISHSFSESSQNAQLNHMIGGFESNNSNISESISKSMHRESVVTGKEFCSLASFEAIALVYDGVKTAFYKIFLKPYFLSDKATKHVDILKAMAAAASLLLVVNPSLALGFPDICSVVKSTDFSTCMEFRVSACTCGYPPHPCAQFNYYIPTSFIEVHPNPGETFFGGLPAARRQLSRLGVRGTPYGAEGDDDTQSFQAHTLSIPLASTVMQGLPCSSTWRDSTCFEAMSEHLEPSWSTGSGDKLQPSFLAWIANPKACLIAGAARSMSGGGPTSYNPGSPMCSVPTPLSQYPPSSHEACNGWGTFYPRGGTYSGPSQTAGALMVASRIKSLASEVFQSTPTVPGEKWQMITPQSSACFREGENIAPLETFKRATEFRRLAGAPPKGYLFAIWQPVSCCKEMDQVPASQALLTAMKAACQGGGL